MAGLKTPPALLSAPPRAVGYATRADAERARDRARAAAAEESLRRLYSTARWRHPETGMRARILTRDGWQCRMCSVSLNGPVNAPNSPVVDHVEPHRGNLVLFWAEDNLQALCKQCHDTTKQAQERRQARR